MLSFVARRLLGMLPLLIGSLILVFVLLRVAPGDPVLLMLSEDATDAQIQQKRESMGLDRSIVEQFLIFVRDVVTLNFGESTRFRQDVFEVIFSRLPASIELALGATLLAVAVGIPLGVIAALRSGTFLDRATSVVGVAGVSVPTFWLGLLLILVVGGVFQWLPTGSRGVQGSGYAADGFFLIPALFSLDFASVGKALNHMILPAIALAAPMAGILVRITRSSMLEVLREDYVRTARAKGLKETIVAERHVFRNALLPVVTVLGLEFASLLSGSIIIETIFAWPGIGELLITAVSARDYALVQGIVIVYVVIFAGVNLLVDISYSIIDPRIRL